MEQSAQTLEEAVYPLDWQTTDVELKGGKYVFTMRRPTYEELLEREADLEFTVEVAKDNSYTLPDRTVQETIDAEYGKLLTESATGYPAGREIPQAHYAAAFNGLYQADIFLDPDCDLFGDEIVVIQEIGADDEPDFVVLHILKSLDEKAIKFFRKKFGGGRVKPGKRGRQVFEVKSHLKAARDCYTQNILRLEGVNVSDPALVDPLVQKKVAETYVNALYDGLLD